MLGLADEIGRDDMRIGSLVGEDQAVGRARDHVDADTAKEDTLGFGHELVSGADQDVGLRQAEQAECHRRDTLNAAHRQDLVGTADMRGIDDRRGDPDVRARRRTGGDMAASGHLGGGHRHDGAGDMAVAPTGHIAARRIDRDRLLPGDHARHDLDLDIRDGRLLHLGKAAHVVMGELDVLLELLGNQAHRRRRSLLRQQDAAVVTVELLGVFQRLRITARLDIGKDVLDRLVHFGRIRFRGQAGLLEVFARHRCRPTCRFPGAEWSRLRAHRR